MEKPYETYAVVQAQLEAQQRRAQEKADQMQSINAMQQQGLQSSIANNALQGVFSTSIGVSTGIGQQTPKSAKEKEGVLIWQGRELPEVWRGAEYKFGARAFVPLSRQWRIEFRSDFSMDTIMLWLDPDKHSGEEADKIAATYLETINQRRLG